MALATKEPEELPFTVQERRAQFDTHAIRLGLATRQQNGEMKYIHPELRGVWLKTSMQKSMSREEFAAAAIDAITTWAQVAYMTGKIDLDPKGKTLRMIARSAKTTPADLTKQRTRYVSDLREDEETRRAEAIQGRYGRVIGKRTPIKRAEGIPYTHSQESRVEAKKRDITSPEFMATFDAQNFSGQRQFLVSLMEEDQRNNEVLRAEGSRYQSTLLHDFMDAYTRYSGITADAMIAKYGPEPKKLSPLEERHQNIRDLTISPFSLEEFAGMSEDAQKSFLEGLEREDRRWNARLAGAKSKRRSTLLDDFLRVYTRGNEEAMNQMIATYGLGQSEPVETPVRKKAPKVHQVSYANYHVMCTDVSGNQYELAIQVEMYPGEKRPYGSLGELVDGIRRGTKQQAEEKRHIVIYRRNRDGTNATRLYDNNKGGNLLSREQLAAQFGRGTPIDRVLASMYHSAARAHQIFEQYGTEGLKGQPYATVSLSRVNNTIRTIKGPTKRRGRESPTMTPIVQEDESS